MGITEVENIGAEAASSTEFKKLKLLLVEDDEEVRTVLSMLLERERYEVLQAENGQIALEMVNQYAPELVLCDLMMPVMDGREFLGKLRSTKLTHNLPVVMLTAADSEANENELLELGADEFVSKTASTKKMLARIRHVVSTLI